MIAETTTTAYRKHWVGDDGRAALRGEDGVWPVYHGRSFNLWEPDTGDYYDSCDSDVMSEMLQSRRQNPSSASPHAGFSESHLADTSALPCRSPRVAIRDITRASDTRTVIAAVIPGERILTQHAAYVLPTERAGPQDEAFAVGVLASMICDWQARCRVELHMGNAEVLGGLSIPQRSDDGLCDRIIEIAGRLSARDANFEHWAERVGVPVASVDDNERAALIAELDALVAVLYGLDQDDLAIVFDTFSESREWDDRRDSVLEYFVGKSGVTSGSRR